MNLYIFNRLSYYCFLQPWRYHFRFISSKYNVRRTHT